MPNHEKMRGSPYPTADLNAPLNAAVTEPQKALAECFVALRDFDKAERQRVLACLAILLDVRDEVCEALQQ